MSDTPIPGTPAPPATPATPVAATAPDPTSAGPATSPTAAAATAAEAPPVAASDSKKPQGPFSKKTIYLAILGVVICMAAWPVIQANKSTPPIAAKNNTEHARVAKAENTRAVANHTTNNISPESQLDGVLSDASRAALKKQSPNRAQPTTNFSQPQGFSYPANPTSPSGAPVGSTGVPSMQTSQPTQPPTAQGVANFLSGSNSQPTTETAVVHASLIVYTRSTSTPATAAQTGSASAPIASTPPLTPIASNAPPFAQQQAPPPNQTAPSAPQQTPSRNAAHNALNSSGGATHKVFEGTMIDTVLTNRLDGTYSGPVNCMVTGALWSHDGQHILIPQGSRALGETNRVSSAGQQRLAVVFHRIITPDGFSISLDQFTGMNQIGENGLKDKVNNHYTQIFGTSLALGAISGLSSITSSGGITQSGSDRMQQGFAQATSQEATHILDRFLNILPTITIREGTRVKIYLTDDLMLPEYNNHTMSPAL